MYDLPRAIIEDTALFKLGSLYSGSSMIKKEVLYFIPEILFTNNACHNLKNYPKALIALGGVVIVATTLNLVFRDKASVGFNMCYISPFRNTPLAVFKDFDVFFKNLLGNYPGRIISIIIYLIGVSLGGFVIYLVIY